jgi:hypothetical protein
VVRLCANCVRAFQKDQKLCTHAHHSDRSVAAAIFANGTYFVDTPRTYWQLLKIMYKERKGRIKNERKEARQAEINSESDSCASECSGVGKLGLLVTSITVHVVRIGKSSVGAIFKGGYLRSPVHICLRHDSAHLP